LVSERNDLAAVMRFVGEHVGEHGRAGRPIACPTPAREFRHPPVGILRQRFFEHLETARGAFAMSHGGLPLRAAKGIERRRAFEVRRRMLQPNQTAVVQVGKDGGDGAALAALLPQEFGTPRGRREMLEEDLVHSVIGRVCFEQTIAKV